MELKQEKTSFTVQFESNSVTHSNIVAMSVLHAFHLGLGVADFGLRVDDVLVHNVVELLHHVLSARERDRERNIPTRNKK